MDASRSDADADARARSFAGWPRRGLLSSLAVAALLGTPDSGAGAKKKKKKCRFSKTETVWTLKKNCTTKAQIELPDGVALDGNGKTIKLAGTTDAVGLAGVRGTGGMRNLTIDGANLQGTCEPSSFCGIFAAGGTVDAVTVRNLPCGIGIVGSLAPTTIINSRVDNVGGGGIGIAVFDEATVQDNAVVDCDSGILVSGTFADGVVINNTVVGRGEIAQKVNGIAYEATATGSVGGNEVSGFFSSNAVACGILLSEGTTPALDGGNTFPNGGNEQNICDFRV